MSDLGSESSRPAGSPGLLTDWARQIKTAFAFLTRFPVSTAGDTSLADAARGFPIVGLAVGAAGAVVYGVVIGPLSLPAAVAALLALAAMMLATGALHEDGLADMADGFGGGRDRDATLAIMRDSRIGTFGVLALIVVVGLRVVCIAELRDGWRVAWALLAAAAGSRALLPWVMHKLPHARSDGLAHHAGRPTARAAIESAALGGLILLVALGVAGLATAAAAAVAAFALARLSQRRIGGQTGDVLGAIQQVSEAAILIAAVATQA
jgi:adenosylcobinamide-GDP ribazoletransferase